MDILIFWPAGVSFSQWFLLRSGRPLKTEGLMEIDLISAWFVAADWQRWCGPTKWVYTMVHFAQLGGLVRWWSGYPQSKSTIPLCFELYTPDHKPIPQVSKGGSRLRDIEFAIDYLIKYLIKTERS